MADADHNQVHGGKTVYGARVGILMLETRFPRVPGDIGHAASGALPEFGPLDSQFDYDETGANVAPPAYSSTSVGDSPAG